MTQATEIAKNLSNHAVFNISSLINELIKKAECFPELQEKLQTLAFCQFPEDDSDPESEPLEYWIVTQWFGLKLAERGETVVDLCGLTVWARKTSGQAIYLDRVIREIAADFFG